MITDNPREEFKQTLVSYLQNAELTDISGSLQRLSMNITPPVLYRYRTCTPRHFAELESEALSFSAPAVFEDDLDDAFISMSEDRIKDMEVLATGQLFPFFSELMEMNLEDCSVALSEALLPTHSPISDLFDGIIPPQRVWKNEDYIGVAIEDKACCINEVFDIITKMISAKDACNRIRRQTKVSCLCEVSDSEEMWNEYGGHGTGFQLEYIRDSLFGMGSCAGTIPLIFPVIYEAERPDMSELAMIIALQDAGFQFLPGDTPIQRHWFASMLKAIYIKGAARYSHEQEWRVVIPDQTINETAFRFSTRLCPASRIRLGKYICSQNEDKLRTIAAKLDVPVVRYDE